MRNFFSLKIIATTLSATVLNLISATGVLAADQTGWIITDKLSGFSHNTRTGLSEVNGVSKKGLVAAIKRGERRLLMYWEQGAANLTYELDDRKFVDGQFKPAVTKKAALKLSHSGSLVYLEYTEKPDAKVWLVQDGKRLRSWPITENVRIRGYGTENILMSKNSKSGKGIEFFRFGIEKNGKINTDLSKAVGNVEGCELTSLADLDTGLFLELICNDSHGRNVVLLDNEQTLEKIASTISDEFLATSLLRKTDTKRLHKGHTAVLSVEGSPDAIQFTTTVNALLTRGLGEPVSMASDESGQQSWNQSYRTLALARLYQKTKHPVFAAIANNAMRNTLSTTNGSKGISDAANPTCGWASRIYSTDKATPISFFINQAVVTGSLIKSCRALGNQCDVETKKQIDENAMCLVRHYEDQFDNETNLYRIVKDVPFRSDGIWAPWNWQVSFAVLLDHAGKLSGSKKWIKRSNQLVSGFFQSAEYKPDGALWRYWPPKYYEGWDKQADVSLNTPVNKPKPNPKYEDLNHAGITLAAACDWSMPEKFKAAVTKRMDTLIANGNVLPKYLDGRGLVGSRYQIANGWDCFKSKSLEQRYSKMISTAGFGQSLLSYVNQFDPKGSFSLKMKLSACKDGACKHVKAWRFQSAVDYLANSPYFSLTQIR